ncbi:hypothetical protein L3Q82_006939 [Scortum barcoo]|uniref:Uncharacterized protein n=1 Tax=Scortum barcoo TaxID=214431 RepID=A0ACB8WWJ0_9TELE|nr:hypothetical protein L3Q82_006939 [Scortum barcoo]
MLALSCRRLLRPPPPASRLSPALCFARWVKIVQGKKPRGEEPPSPGQAPHSPGKTPLSPEQLERMARNKRAALQKLSSAQTPPGFGESWREGLRAEFGKPYFKQLTSFVCEERKRHTVYPPADQVFTWTQVCDIRDVKVVILGQDPYHGPNQAHGLCFSVKRPVPPPPSRSAVNRPAVFSVRVPARQVCCCSTPCWLLTVRLRTGLAHQANSHKDKGWETFTDAVVHWLSSNLEGLVFMLWGSYAQKKGAAINRKGFRKTERAAKKRKIKETEINIFILLQQHVDFYVEEESRRRSVRDRQFR